LPPRNINICYNSSDCVERYGGGYNITTCDGNYVIRITYTPICYKRMCKWIQGIPEIVKTCSANQVCVPGEGCKS